MRQETADFVAQWEGFRSVAYRDVAGIWTIGYGFTEGVRKGDKINLDDAKRRLRETLQKFEDAVLSATTVSLNENELTALTSFAYNVGVSAYKKSTLRRLLNEGQRLAAAEQFLRWNKAGGQVIQGLTNRREAERKLFLTKPGGAKPQP